MRLQWVKNKTTRICPWLLCSGSESCKACYERYREGIEDSQMGEPHTPSRKHNAQCLSPPSLFDHLCEKTFELRVSAHKKPACCSSACVLAIKTPLREEERLCAPVCPDTLTHTHTANFHRPIRKLPQMQHNTLIIRPC